MAEKKKQMVKVPVDVWHDIEEGLFQINATVHVLRMYAHGDGMSLDDGLSALGHAGNVLRMLEQVTSDTSELTDSADIRRS